MATRFQLYIHQTLGRVTYDGAESHWQPTDHDVKLIAWLTAQLGRPNRDTYKLPMRGPGWILAEAHGGDANLEDYSWRRVMGTQYQALGTYGYWLEIEDDEVAVMLRLSGLLDERPRGARMLPASLDYDPNYWNSFLNFVNGK